MWLAFRDWRRPPSLSSSSGKRSEAERDPGIHAVTPGVGWDAGQCARVLGRAALPKRNGMDPGVCTASLLSLLRPRMTKGECSVQRSGVDVFGAADGRGDGQTVFPQSFDVKADCIADFGFGLGDGCARRDTARQIGDVGGVVISGFFDHNGVAHFIDPSGRLA